MSISATVQREGNLWNYYSVFIGCRLPVAGQNVPNPTRTFAPGEEVWEFLPIGFNEEVTFGKGTYEIEAVWSPESLNEIESPPQVITVIPPSDADIRALNIVSSQLSHSFYNIENSPYFFYSPGFDLSAEEKSGNKNSSTT